MRQFTCLLVLICLSQGFFSMSLACEEDHGLGLDREELAALGCLKQFLSLAAADKAEKAYALILSDSKQLGDPTAYRAKLDFESFVRELGALKPQRGSDQDGEKSALIEDQRHKFTDFEIKSVKRTTVGEFEISISFGGWDNDVARIIKGGDDYDLVNPIHLIR